MASSSSSSPISNQLLQPTTTANSDRPRRKRKYKPPPSQSSLSSPPRASLQRWSSEKQQQIYTTKLVQALSELRISRSPESPPSSMPRSGRAVREAADRTLAVAARGRTLWSRALLASRSVKLKFRKHKRRKISSPATGSATGVGLGGSSRSRKRKGTVVGLKGKKSLPSVQRKVKVLSRLVPGCRKQALPVVLEETSDYIAAMQMQIRAMTAILNAVPSSS